MKSTKLHILLNKSIRNFCSDQVNLEDDNHRMTGGSLSGDEYVLKQFHVHFGSKVKPEGSEHTLNGKRFPGEVRRKVTEVNS